MKKALSYEHGAEVYKVLANAKRLMIIHTLNGKELSVDELAKKLDIRKTNVSQHLTILRHIKLVMTRKHGTRVYYRITDPRIFGCCEIIKNFTEKHR
jgi:ArsR family transcriptional regulator, virulence genes transcriptional regulator